MSELSEEQRKELKILQKRERDRNRYVRITTMLMLDSGFSAPQVAEALGIDQGTVYKNRINFHSSKAIGEYLSFHYVGKECFLDKNQLEKLSNELETYLYISSEEVRAFILEEFGYDYSISGVTKLLNKLGFVYKKTKLYPIKANIDSQKDFQSGINDLLETKEVYYLDAVHPQHNTSSGYGWIKKGSEYEIASNTGRQRINILGALNAKDVTKVITDSYETINKFTVVNFIEKLEKRVEGREVYLICDNARYFHSLELKKWLVHHPNIHIRYLPPYAPNLNLIERLWKFMRKEVITYEYSHSFDLFKMKIMDFFDNISFYKDKLTSLLTLNFKFISN